MLESSLALSRAAPTTTTASQSLARWIPGRTRRGSMRSRTLARLASSLAPSASILSASTSTAAKTRRQRLASPPPPRSFASAAAASASTSRGAGNSGDNAPLSFVAASERGTSLLASLLSRARRPGDVLLLYGDVGAGKSAFARSFVRAAALDEELPVPSPTFLLHNVYDDDVVADGGPAIHHFDLYRLGGDGGDRVSSDSRRRIDDGSPSVPSPSPSALSVIDAERCGLAEALSLSSGDGAGVSLVEWADRLGGAPSGPSSSSPPPPSSSSAPFRLRGEQRVLEVAIEPLSSEEVRSSGIAERHPRLAEAAVGRDEEDKDENEETDDDEDEFADTRWRRITLRPRGARARQAAEDASKALREIVGGGLAIEQE